MARFVSIRAPLRCPACRRRVELAAPGAYLGLGFCPHPSCGEALFASAILDRRGPLVRIERLSRWARTDGRLRPLERAVLTASVVLGVAPTLAWIVALGTVSLCGASALLALCAPAWLAIWAGVRDKRELRVGREAQAARMLASGEVGLRLQAPEAELGAPYRGARAG